MCVCVSVCVCVCVSVASVTQDKMRMRRVILSPVVCPALQYFFTLPHKRHEFRKKIIEHQMGVFVSSTIYVRNSSHSKKN